ncbi:RDD family protein [Streptomyces sp. XD-27]|uniref:RDD family protein n=1 Tax=Streptomyces sp. XD-27 TaxID=3062779 RepID=UPI0026F44065|nr:RDD family protein [Streptomyces sp. XD-27]WKX70594.1 RDD family protein [Streptomyces sp. XD-27]
MSAPTSGSADGSSIPGFYPDPSIPGYIRYWNGAAWVPGTSRPAPAEGEAMPTPPPGITTADRPDAEHASAQTQITGALPDETGPVFLDTPPASGSGGGAVSEARAERDADAVTPRPADEHDPQWSSGSRPEPASAWQADASRQSGFGAEPGRRVSWGAGGPGGAAAPGGGAPAARDPRLGVSGAPVPGARTGGEPGRADGSGNAPALPPTGPIPAQAGAAPGGTSRTDAGGGGAEGGPSDGRPAAASGTGPGGPAAGQGPAAPGSDGTLTMRATRPDSGGASGAGTPDSASAPSALAQGGAPARDEGTLTFRAQRDLPQTPPPARPLGGAPGRYPQEVPPGGSGARGEDGGTATPPASPPPAGAGQHPGVPAQGGPVPGGPAPAAAVPQSPPGPPGWAQQQAQRFPQQPGPGGAPGPGAAPGAAAPGAGPNAPAPASASAPAPGPDAVIPWKPPVDNPFLRAAQAPGRPAPLGRRFLARLIDTIVLLAAVGAAAVPLWGKATDHIDGKIDEAKRTGETVTVYLLDGTTGAYLGILLGVLMLAGVVYEALPTAKWGRTLGKKLCGLRTLDIEDHDTPSFGAALRRWLVYGVLGVLVIGFVNVLWCLFDRPWRQCWHDKAARTFVATTADRA